MIWVFSILFIVYFLSMVALYCGFKKLPFFSAQSKPVTGFSVVIPFRNEAENLQNMLDSIENIGYPTGFFEVLFVNDASEDASEEIISEGIKKSNISMKLLQNNRLSISPKKDAISEAINHATFGWVVTTDADCSLPQQWLKTLDGFIQKENPAMVCGPVIYESNDSFIENFQRLDGLSLQAVTLGSFGLNSPLLCNGANLAYRKDAFLQVNGFSGNDAIASGDDIFMMEKMKKTFPGQVRFLKSKESIVVTKPQKSWKNIVNQRIRWASKTTKQNNLASFLLGIIVFFVNFSIFILPLLMIFDFENFIFYLLFLCFKIILDFIVLRQAAHFFESKINFWQFFIQTWVYSLVFLRVVYGSFGGGYSWKGRRFLK